MSLPNYALFFLLFWGKPCFPQIIIGPYQVDVFTIDTIFSFQIISPDFCTYQAQLQIDSINPFVSGLSTYLHVIDATNTTIDGVIASSGDSLLIDAAGSTISIFTEHLNFQLRVIGIPNQPFEEHPCWINQEITGEGCSPVITLLWGENTIPCTVIPFTSIPDRLAEIPVSIQQNELTWNGPETASISIYDLNGRMISTFFNLRNGSMIDIRTFTTTSLVVRATTASSSYHKLILKN